MIRESVFFAVLISLGAYELGIMLKKKFKFAFFNPLLIAIVVVAAVLLFGHIDYETYSAGAKYLSYFLTPATVCLAIPLYEQVEKLKRNWKAIFAGILSGVFTSMLCVLAMSLLFGLDHEMYVTLLPKSITTAIGMGVAEESGGIVAIAVAVIVVTGVFGNIVAEYVFKLFKIEEPVAKGIGLGTSSHAIGTAKAFEIGTTEGAMGSLSIAVAGVLTVIAAPLFAGFFPG